jgi:hypothetical protein
MDILRASCTCLAQSRALSPMRGCIGFSVLIR